MGEPVTIATTDGVELEAELAPAPGTARASVVLCHPHPRYGGTMRSLVISALFAALPPVGVTTLRFNFRGVEASTGAWDEGHGEQLDVAAAVDHLAGRARAAEVGAAGTGPGAALLLAGWSFGADLALSDPDARVTGWLAIAPPLRYARSATVAADERPKLLALAEHDEVRDPAEVEAITAGWRNTEITIVGGASHFFVGRTDRLVELTRAFVDRLVGSRR